MKLILYPRLHKKNYGFTVHTGTVRKLKFLNNVKQIDDEFEKSQLKFLFTITYYYDNLIFIKRLCYTQAYQFLN